jgi:hypothetical protein
MRVGNAMDEDRQMHETGRIPNAATIADQLAIHDVLARHSRGVDRGDSAILRACYWSDAQVAYGAFDGDAHVFCERLPKMMRAFKWTHHSIGNVAIDFDGTHARVETYVTARHYIVDAAGDYEMTVFGRYLDRMQRRGDAWKIAHRRVLMDWNRRDPASAKWQGPPFEGLARGTRGVDDPLYGHLGA